MRWGMHEVDASHQLSSLVMNALTLLLEVLPDEQRSCKNLQLDGSELQRVLLRSMALDSYLDGHLFIE